MLEFLFALLYFFLTFGLVVISIVIVRKKLIFNESNSLVILMIPRKKLNFWQKRLKTFQV